jgi:hypothetical protein
MRSRSTAFLPALLASLALVAAPLAGAATTPATTSHHHRGAVHRVSATKKHPRKHKRHASKSSRSTHKQSAPRQPT